MLCLVVQFVLSRLVQNVHFNFHILCYITSVSLHAWWLFRVVNVLFAQMDSQLRIHGPATLSEVTHFSVRSLLWSDAFVPLAVIQYLLSTVDSVNVTYI